MLDQPGRQAEQWWDCIQRAKSQTASQLQSTLCFAGRVFPLFSSRQSQDTLPSDSLFLCSLLCTARDCTENETKCHAIPAARLSFPFSRSGALLSLFFLSQSLFSGHYRAKWFAAAKKISLFSSHSRSLAAPPLASSLSLTCLLSLSLSSFLPPCSLAVCV